MESVNLHWSHSHMPGGAFPLLCFLYVSASHAYLHSSISELMWHYWATNKKTNSEKHNVTTPNADNSNNDKKNLPFCRWECPFFAKKLNPYGPHSVPIMRFLWVKSHQRVTHIYFYNWHRGRRQRWSQQLNFNPVWLPLWENTSWISFSDQKLSVATFVDSFTHSSNHWEILDRYADLFRLICF